MHLNWNAQPRTRRVWLPSPRAGLRRLAPWSVPELFWLAWKAREPASSAGVGDLHPHRYEVAQALRTVGTERTAGPAATGQAGYLRHRFSQPGTGAAGATAAVRHVALGWAG